MAFKVAFRVGKGFGNSQKALKRDIRVFVIGLDMLKGIGARRHIHALHVL